MTNDESMSLFYKSVLDAADRGVKVNILLDGIFNEFTIGSRQSLNTFEEHPNVSFKYYEPLNLIKPWTWNNRLHDKSIIVDDKYALIGGRNIGNKYFLERSTKLDLVRDRDVLIYSPNKDDESIIQNMKEYYEYVWNSKYSKKPYYSKKDSEEKIKEYREKINIDYEKYKDQYKEKEPYNWDEIAKTVEHIEFAHNPIERFNKQPWAFRKLLSLSSESYDNIEIQSPYIVFTKSMKREMDKYNIDYKNIDILTNSYKSSPNFPAISGYSNIRKKIVRNVRNVFEYQGDDSIHGKTYIFDSKKSVIGSFNLDSRSAYLSTESFVVIDNDNFADELQDKLDNYIVKSYKVEKDGTYLEEKTKEIVKPSKFKVIAIKVLSKVLYLFDYML